MFHQKDQLRKIFLFLKKYRKVALEPRSRVDAICQDRKTVFVMSENQLARQRHGSDPTNFNTGYI
jgi:hypothetical protein